MTSRFTGAPSSAKGPKPIPPERCEEHRALSQTRESDGCHPSPARGLGPEHGVAGHGGLAAAAAAPPTSVTHVFPSSDVLPENQLRIYIHFSGPMGRRP